MRILKLSLFYFTSVFLIGTLLGFIRVLLLQACLGRRYAEILEISIMTIWIWQAAQLTIWELGVGDGQDATSSTPILIGAISLFFLITTEVAATALQKGGWARGVDTYLRDRDVVAGVAYALALVAFAVMPWHAWSFQASESSPIAFVVDAPMQEDYCDR